jgi:predicted site-specific integrase-resolvase
MRWISAQQVRELIREVMGWEIHPNTLYKWVKAGKLRNYSPGGKMVFYPVEDVAKLLRMEPSELLAIVQKEKGGRP